MLIMVTSPGAMTGKGASATFGEPPWKSQVRNTLAGENGGRERQRP